MSDNLRDLYRDIIMDHYRYPRGKKEIDDASVKSEGKNPSCGDEIKLSLKIDDDRVKEVSVSCQGCAISVASGSILSELVVEKDLDEVKKIARIVKSMLKGEEDPDLGKLEMGDLEALQGVKDFPVRIKCALLSWTTLIEGIESWQNSEEFEVSTTEN
ncbi:MAG: SUF system NifU family Fe-S cluster assembly protein [candidate division Zixibacteria bacterium]|nr:SUF system NifU family Fe-S cluster assembly protein [candidate division Zixibacteria bacterium]